MKEIGKISALIVAGMLVGLGFPAMAFVKAPVEETDNESDLEILDLMNPDLEKLDPMSPDLEELDHFKCYSTLGKRFINETVDLEDQFGSDQDVQVLYRTDFCNPVEKTHNGSVTPIKNPDAHLAKYLIKAPQAPDRQVTVSNQFGSNQPLNVSQPHALLVPTQNLSRPEPKGLDHFKCYEVFGQPVHATVDLRDQFHLEENVSVLYPIFLCNPVVKVHANILTPVLNPDAHLVCYVIKGAPLPYKLMRIRNQFGIEYLRLRYAQEICVPSEKEAEEDEKLDHFKCYSAFGERFINETVYLQDQFGFNQDVQVLHPIDFCNPVEKTHNGDVTPIKNPDAHLTKYMIKAPQAPYRQATVSNQFGSNQPLNVSQPYALLVPTQKDLSRPEPKGLDHFMCYKVFGQPVHATVDLRDQFHLEENVSVLYPFALCNPVIKVHADIKTPVLNPDSHLVCYVIGSPYYGEVSIRNQFGTDKLRLTSAREICVPSEKDVKKGEKLDHFKCYLTYGMPSYDSVLLRDQFGEAGALVLYPRLFCNPVEKLHDGNVTPIQDPDAHLKMYMMYTYEKSPTRQVEISNQFGEEQELDVGRPYFLAVPTQKHPHQPPEGLDHFKCYIVSGQSTYAYVGLLDQFKNDPGVLVYSPFLLCNPVQKTHKEEVTSVEHPKDHLVCYRISQRPYYGYVSTTDQFGNETLRVRQSYMLCVPSVKKVPPPSHPFIQELCGQPVSGFNGGNVLPGDPGTGLFRDNPDATWPEGRPRRPCGKFVPVDGPDITLTLSGADRFRVAYRLASDPVPPLGTAPGIPTKWNLLEWNGFECIRDPGTELETDGSPQEWMDASDYLEAKNGLLTGCGNGHVRWAVWDTILGAGDPNGHYVLWVEWDDGALHKEPFEHHLQLDNSLPIINKLELRLQDGVTVVYPCGGAPPGEHVLKVYADFEDDPAPLPDGYYWRYKLRIRGGIPPASHSYGWHHYYDGTPEVANTDETGTTPDDTLVFLREIDLNDLGVSFTNLTGPCCFVLDLWVGDSSIRHNFNSVLAWPAGYGSPFLDNKFLTFAAGPP